MQHSRFSPLHFALLSLVGLLALSLLVVGCGLETPTEQEPDVVSDLTRPASSLDATASSDVAASVAQGATASAKGDVLKYDRNKIAALIFFTPSSVPTAGKVSPPFGPVVFTWTTEYDAFGVHFSTGPPGPNTPTGMFSDPPLAWGGVNGVGDVDLLAPVDGLIVVPGTGGKAGQTSSLTVEGGFAGVGNLLLEVFDCNGSLIGSTINDDGIGPTGRTLMSLAFPGGPGIAAFRVSTPAGDTYGVDSIELDDPTPCVTKVDLDIKPDSFPNSINTKSKGNIPVAVLGSASFDVDDINRSTLAFGPNDATPAHNALGHLEDVNIDGFLDLVSHYKTQDTGLAVGDIEACVKGTTTGGQPFEGCDSVRIVK